MAQNSVTLKKEAARFSETPEQIYYPEHFK